ncbi:hypothetical protein D0Z07_1476 [Hyphodiscus hymeniophilus]|uniref:CENP-V/GFA domain-containing protein n=1 Tax=Hyphodiscus hymeniophilus TaxID=353542 RepID=A0A9P6VQM9_9HELO|nr:hypothetical protein D0Z07_1476 [Hyphodiscus hymeniophilus]
MSAERPLQGGCSCGRNKYSILIPEGATEVAQVYFDSSLEHRRSQASPLSAWLRVPLSWYHSSTYAFYDDETHSTIRRTYTSPSETHSKRQFCGFCGTPLTYWTEASPEQADHICLTLGSLTGEDLRDLEDIGLLPKEALDDAENDKEKIENVVPFAGSNNLNGGGSEGLPWFQTMVEGSRLGKISRGHGERRVGNGRYTVEWEIMEWNEGDPEPSPAKRKLGEIDVEDGSKMEH